jgi:hypothetical protein
MQLVVSGIKAECPRCRGTEFDRPEETVLFCTRCSTRHAYGLLLALVAQRALDNEACRNRANGSLKR